MQRRSFLQALPALAAPSFAAARRPNVILILTDDLGYADLGCYGARDIRTPHIDSLAKEGVRFTNCYSNGPVCTPTRAGLMTGMYQQRFGLEWALSPGQKGYGLEDKNKTIATRLKQNGYKTAIYGKWHLGYEPEFGPNRHGFDDFFGILSGNVDFYSHKEVNGQPDLYENLKPVTHQGYLTEELARRATKYVDNSGADPFFLYVPFNGVHWPFQAPGRPNDIRERATWHNGTRADYAQMVESVDQGVGHILDAVKRKGIARDTVVIFTNDNGGERLSDNRPFAHRKATLWEGGIRVPGIVRWPGVAAAGKVSAQPAASMDLAATVLDAAGVDAPANLDGKSLRTHLTTGAMEPRTYCWRINRPNRRQQAVRKGTLKYLNDAGIEMVFDLAADPGERADIARLRPAELKEMRQIMTDWEADIAKNPPPKVIA